MTQSLTGEGRRGGEAVNKKIFVGLFLLWGAVGAMIYAGLEPLDAREKTGAKGAPPVISQSFASQQLRPGETWKVYLIASDPDGDMKNILCTIDQPGVGVYPVSTIRIKEPNRRELSGYVYLVTRMMANLHGVNLTLTVQIQDNAGHFSKPVQFPLSINDTYKQEPPPEGIFKEVELGPIMVNLRTVTPGGSPFRKGF